VDLSELIEEERGVLSVSEALTVLTVEQLRWRIASERWQQIARGVVVTHSGPLTPEQRVLVDLKRCGASAVLAGLSAAAWDGLTGFPPRRTQILLPEAHKLADTRGREVRRSRHLGPSDVLLDRRPPRTRLPRSLVDAAGWTRTDDGCRAILAAGVQQRLVRTET
jgi:hypothetical protein